MRKRAETVFGYITINQGELKVKEYEAYRAYYCALCHVLHKKYGRIGQLQLSYDMTFLSVLLTSLYELDEQSRERRCAVHPAPKHRETYSEAADYVADMTILLSYQKAMDDWNDDRNFAARALALDLYGDYKKLRRQYPRQAKALEKNLEILKAQEKKKSPDMDRVSGRTGAFLGEIFIWKEEEPWNRDLYQLGFHLGKFIYLMDAFDDIEKDERKGSYNILLPVRSQDPEHFDSRAKELMVREMAYAARSFERLPVLKNTEILRNILYSGVWVKYRKIMEDRKKEKAEDDEKSI